MGRHCTAACQPTEIFEIWQHEHAQAISILMMVVPAVEEVLALAEVVLSFCSCSYYYCCCCADGGGGCCFTNNNNRNNSQNRSRKVRVAVTVILTVVEIAVIGRLMLFFNCWAAIERSSGTSCNPYEGAKRFEGLQFCTSCRVEGLLFRAWMPCVASRV